MLEVHCATRSEALVDRLAEILAAPLADPFTSELVAVPTRGIERWITQRLSSRLGAARDRGDGVCANVDFPTPGRVVAEALAAAGGPDARVDPWRPERLVWALLETIDHSLDEAWIEPLARHFRAHPERRLSRARALAQLFDYYGQVRPTLIQSWARAEEDHWQAELWRRTRTRIAIDSPAERLPAGCRLLREQPETLSLPPRIAVFGLTRLPAAHLEVLQAIASGRDVHMLLNTVGRRERQPGEPGNRLLASWGRESQALRAQLRAAGAGPLTGGTQDGRGEPAGVAGETTAVSGDTLLHAIQDGIRRDLQAPGKPAPGQDDQRLLLRRDDHSIRVHSCHGRARQVEILREAILHRLAADATLQPRDVIVMCPDVEAFAPLIEATFGAHDDRDDGTRVLRVRIADRSLRQTNPVLGVISRLLELASGRVTATEVLDLADAEPVRRRFRFDDDDLATVRAWVAQAAINWGIDTEHRARYKLAGVEGGTWRAGLRRILLGVAMADDGRGPFIGVVPVDGVPSDTIELAGRFTEFVDRLRSVLRSLDGAQLVSGWASALSGAADALTATTNDDAWQRGQLDSILAEIGESAPSSGRAAELALPDLRALLGHRLEGRPTRANFRTGHLTVCTLTPMRSVPHRIVCLLGLDDGAFPRRGRHNGDDVLLQDPQPGDRDPRAQDRQLLLDAVLAAQDAVIITYSGHDERTNAPRPPAVPVGELLDAIDGTARCYPPAPSTETRFSSDSTSTSKARLESEPNSEIDSEPESVPTARARDAVLVKHPLQPFDPLNFKALQGPSPVGDGPWSFDRAALEGARAVTGPRRPPAPFLGEPLPPPDDDGVITLDQLVAFVQRPARAFLHQRLGVSLLAPRDEISDVLPLELDALARWDVGRRLLESRLAGLDPTSAALAEYARGTLPPGKLGEAVLNQIAQSARLLADEALRNAGGSQARSLETNLTFEDGRRLIGTVSGVHGNLALTVTYARLNARERIGAWVRFLALNAAHPELPLEAVTIGRAGRAGGTGAAGGAARATGARNMPEGAQVIRIRQLGADPRTRASRARAELQRLLDLRAQGLREPLPLPCLSGEAYAAALRDGRDPIAAALEVWTSTFSVPREDREPEHEFLWERRLDAEALAARAQALWEPLLSREVDP
jgi:exodeoxyribonuclease V gamma subunit